MDVSNLFTGLAFGWVERALGAAVAIVLLTVEPASRPKRLLAAVLLLNAASVVGDLAYFVKWDGVYGSGWSVIGNAVGDLGFLALLGFVATWPTPVRLRSLEGATLAAFAAFLVVSLFSSLFAGLMERDTFDRIFSVYGIVHALITFGAALFAMRRAKALEEPARGRAMLLVNALVATACIFAGYFSANWIGRGLGLHYRNRYGVSTDFWALATFFLEVGVAAYFVFATRRRLPLLLALVGVLALILDQISRWDLIDIGISSVVLPLVAFHGVARGGLFGVENVPPKIGIVTAVAVGLASCVLVALVVALVAPTQPIVIMLGGLAGLVVGSLVGYAVRPRGVGISVYGSEGSDTPGRALTGTVAEPGALVAGRYRVQRSLGAGGEAQAFLARDELLSREIVLKRVQAPPGTDAAKHAVREARIVAGLDHPNIIRVHDVIETARETLVVLEYAPGGNLHGLIRRKGRLERTDAVTLLGQVLGGLAAAHAKGIVHGDVKPENVLLDASGAAKLADFGAARESSAGGTEKMLPSGTLLTMAPEQVRGLTPDARSDTYAAGLLLHEMISGRPIVDARGIDDFQLRARLIEAPRLSVPEAWPDVEVFLRKALAPDPNERFQDARAMVNALSALGARS